MLLFEDYAPATSKLAQVYAQLRSSIKTSDVEERDTRAEIELARRELAGIRVSPDNAAHPDRLTQAIADLRRLLEELEVDGLGAAVTVEALRRLRGHLELLAGECDSRVERLAQVTRAELRRGCA